MTSKTELVICGGGNGAHTLAGMMSMNDDMEIIVLIVYRDGAERWNKAMTKQGFCVNFRDGVSMVQKAGCVKFLVTRDETVVQKADFVLICMPAFAHELYLKTIVPHLPDDCSVVGVPGHPGFEYQCLFYLQQYGKACNIMSLASLPWCTRIVNYGTEVMVIGTKKHVAISFVKRNEISSNNTISCLQRAFGKSPILNKVHALALTLTILLHPPIIMYSRWRDWDGVPLDTQPLFYTGVDKDAAEIMDAITNEIIAISTAIKDIYPHLDFSCLTSTHWWLKEHYGSQIEDDTSLLTSLLTNKAYTGLKHPVIKTDAGKYIPDFRYRYLSEDVPYGLVVIRAIADLVKVKTLTMDKVIVWTQTKLGREYLVDGNLSFASSEFTRLPQTYGIDSIETLVNTLG